MKTIAKALVFIFFDRDMSIFYKASNRNISANRISG
jgi:hypothetical protein